MHYSLDELLGMGFNNLGKNVLISRRTSIDDPSTISIGNNVKIGSYVILSGKIHIGSYVHIASFSSLYGSCGIYIQDFISISNYVRLITESDDYYGYSMSAPFVPDKYRFNVNKGAINVKKHCIIGSGSVVLPGIALEEGVAVGSMSMVSKKTKEWGIYAGIPAKRIKERSRNMLELEKQFLQESSKFENFNH